jgi:DNA-binding FrmR family transcriptional regulator
MSYAVGMNSTKSPGYLVSKEPLLTRLRRIQGQIEGIERMVEDERYCIDVLTQISAAQAALDKVSLGLLDDHTRHCMVEVPEGEREDKAEEMMAAVGRLLRSR